MLESFRVIRNVGRFDAVTNTPAFGKLTLAYSENGKGKTTLCAVLRSLATGNVEPLLERKRLGSSQPQSVVANVDSTQFVFTPSGWNNPYSKPILVFDEKFVDDNVYSGLSVAAGQRKNLHELVLGAQGVQFQQRVVELTNKIADLQKVLRAKERKLSRDIIGNLSIDEFCDLPNETGIDEAMEVAQAAVSVVKASAAVAEAQEFETVAFPKADKVEIEKLLTSALASVHEESVTAVNRHFKSLGKGGEAWVSEGKKISSSSSNDDCPFCGSELKSSDLFKHYEAYFSEAYEGHLQTIREAKASFEKDFGGDTLAGCIGRLGELKVRHEFWKAHIDLPEFSIGSTEIETAWKRLRISVLKLLEEKLENPLGEVQLTETVADEIEEFAQLVSKAEQLCNELVEKNEDIKRAKEQASHGSLPAAVNELARLETIKRRHQPENIALCLEYVNAKKDKLEAETQKTTAKNDLDQYRATSFPACQTSVNKFLLRFNADFSLESFEAVDPQGQPSSSYKLTVNHESVPISTKNADPCFGNTLSTGDRNTLALAFFFASLESNPDLADAIVVIDDPASSLDDGRTVATAQEIRKLVGVTEQVIVLSHSRRLLCEIWGNGNHASAESVKISDGGPDLSKIETWDVSSESASDYDLRHKVIREYAEQTIGVAGDVAVALRPALEGFLRAACVENFSPDTMLGNFISHARNLEGNGNPIIATADLDELDELRVYANRFHHDNPSWQTELSNINETELRGYARRVLDFTRALRRIT